MDRSATIAAAASAAAAVSTTSLPSAEASAIASATVAPAEAAAVAPATVAAAVAAESARAAAESASLATSSVACTIATSTKPTAEPTARASRAAVATSALALPATLAAAALSAPRAAPIAATAFTATIAALGAAALAMHIRQHRGSLHRRAHVDGRAYGVFHAEHQPAGECTAAAGSGRDESAQGRRSRRRCEHAGVRVCGGRPALCDAAREWGAQQLGGSRALGYVHRPGGRQHDRSARAPELQSAQRGAAHVRALSGRRVPPVRV